MDNSLGNQIDQIAPPVERFDQIPIENKITRVYFFHLHVLPYFFAFNFLLRYFLFDYLFDFNLIPIYDYTDNHESNCYRLIYYYYLFLHFYSFTTNLLVLTFCCHCFLYAHQSNYLRSSPFPFYLTFETTNFKHHVGTKSESHLFLGQ